MRAVLSLGIVLGLGSVGTLAAWSDSATATSNEFKTGKIDLKLGPEPGVDSYTFSAFNGSGLMPGSTVQAPLDLRNAGDAPFKYTIKAKVTGSATVAPQIALSVFGTSNCTGTALGAIAAMSTTDQDLLATNNARGPVATSTADTICVRATAGDRLTKAMQSQSVSVVLTFAATQTP
ncbi:SipW-dependent-type signal peptide-containing protein [Prescottella equi]|uniref:SipW-dependent-type signal peptide-containing protein n=1 Tax=Rhodococcus hoagii TaxID=43767 RepID=UPI001EEB60DB|nr:SipW-dependent-type signal peptide-containing protein [Prescottella equi]